MAGAWGALCAKKKGYPSTPREKYNDTVLDRSGCTEPPEYLPVHQGIVCILRHNRRGACALGHRSPESKDAGARKSWTNNSRSLPRASWGLRSRRGGWGPSGSVIIRLEPEQPCPTFSRAWLRPVRCLLLADGMGASEAETIRHRQSERPTGPAPPTSLVMRRRAAFHGPAQTTNAVSGPGNKNARLHLLHEDGNGTQLSNRGRTRA